MHQPLFNPLPIGVERNQFNQQTNPIPGSGSGNSTDIYLSDISRNSGFSSSRTISSQNDSLCLDQLRFLHVKLERISDQLERLLKIEEEKMKMKLKDLQMRSEELKTLKEMKQKQEDEGYGWTYFSWFFG